MNDQIEGRANYTSEIDKLLTLGAVQRTLFKDYPMTSVAARAAAECSL